MNWKKGDKAFYQSEGEIHWKKVTRKIIQSFTGPGEKEREQLHEGGTANYFRGGLCLSKEKRNWEENIQTKELLRPPHIASKRPKLRIQMRGGEVAGRQQGTWACELGGGGEHDRTNCRTDDGLRGKEKFRGMGQRRTIEEGSTRARGAKGESVGAAAGWINTMGETKEAQKKRKRIARARSRDTKEGKGKRLEEGSHTATASTASRGHRGEKGRLKGKKNLTRERGKPYRWLSTKEEEGRRQVSTKKKVGTK